MEYLNSSQKGYMNLSTIPALTLTNPAPAIASLLQSGKITAEQAALASSTNRNSLFSLFLAEYQGADKKADNYGYDAQDPYSALFPDEKDTGDSGLDMVRSTLYDSLMYLL